MVSVGDDSKITFWSLDNNTAKLKYDKKVNNSWLLDIDYDKEGNFVSVGDMKGNLHIIGEYITYLGKFSVPITRVQSFQKTHGGVIYTIIATRGKGAILVSSKMMKPKNI